MAESSANTWQHFLSAEKAQFLLESGHLCDCTLVVGSADANNSKKFQCHKFILTSASPMFERMLFGDFKESSLNEIKLEQDIEPTDFGKFLDFIYYNDNNLLESLSIDTLKNLIYLGNMYLVKSLTDACFNVIKNKIKSLGETDIIKVFELAHFIENADLKKEIIEHIQSVMKAIGKNCSYCGHASTVKGVCGIPSCDGSIMISPLITCPYIYEMSSCIFYEFVKALIGVSTETVRFRLIETYVLFNSNIINESNDIPSVASVEDSKKKEPLDVIAADEIEAKSAVNNATTNNDEPSINGAIKKLTVAADTAEIQANAVVENQNSQSNSWIEEDDDFKSKKMLKKLLSLIDFNKMNAREFCHGPGKSKLLNLKEKYDLLTNICLPRV